MDTRNEIHQHSKEKLMVYREYLLGYFSVLTNPLAKDVNVIDVFAGMGISDNREEGSALVAAKVIEKFRQKVQASDRLRFFANEKSSENYARLKKNLARFNFPVITNQSADDFITDIFARGCLAPQNFQNSKSLLFVDPFGYTQVSQQNLNKMFSDANAEILLLIPTSSVYRFKNWQDGPAYRFVSDLGVSASTIRDIDSSDELAKQILRQIKAKSKTDFVYSYGLKNKGAPNSEFHLFFVTRHVTGARKFLEAKNKIKNTLRKQLTLLDEDESVKQSDLRAILAKEVTNRDLCVRIIQCGYLPKEVRPILVNWEQSDIVQVRCNFARRVGAYYLQYDHEKTIHLKIANP